MGTHQARRMFSPHKNKSTPVSCGPEIFYGAKRRIQEWWSFVLGTLIPKREKSFLLTLKLFIFQFFLLSTVVLKFQSKYNVCWFILVFLLFWNFIVRLFLEIKKHYYQWLLSFNYDINKSLFTKRSEIVRSYLYPRHMTKKHSVP